MGRMLGGSHPRDAISAFFGTACEQMSVSLTLTLKVSMLSQIATRSNDRQALGGMQKAVPASNTHGAITRAAADHFHVSRSSLDRDRTAVKNGRVIGRIGRPEEFSDEDEEEMVQCCLQQERERKPFTKRQLAEYVRV